MECSIQVGEVTFSVQLGADASCAICIPVKPHTPEEMQISAFHLPPSSAEAVSGEGFIGDVREGGSVNCETVSFNPHGNGTHTECIGHVTKERIHVVDVIARAPLVGIALVVSVLPQTISTSSDTYPAAHTSEDKVVSKDILKKAVDIGLEGCDVKKSDLMALVVRTLPCTQENLSAKYSGTNPTYFTPAATAYVRSLGVTHLLVDLPSVDRECDEGLLPSHHAFWGITRGVPLGNNVPNSTITELIHVPGHIKDGVWFLDLHVSPFALDAAPSRPILYPMYRK